MIKPFRQGIVALIVQYTKFILTFVYITEFFLAFSPQTFTGGSAFPLNSLNDTLIVFDPYANDGRTDAKYTVG